MRNNLFLSLAAVLFLSANAQAVVRLTPQDVVDLALKQGPDAKTAELQAQRGYLAYQNALGRFDFTFNVTPYYEYTEAETLQGVQNLADRTYNVTASLAKKIRTGTTLSLEYLNTQRNSTFDANQTTNNRPNINLNAAGFGVRQELWRNSFGYADRLALEVGRGTIKAALEQREESIETVLLDAITLFWNTYIAQQQLKANLQAREKYDALVKNARRRSGYNLVSPGEVPRLQAEFEGADRNVKTSSAQYLTTLQELLSKIQYDTKDTVELVVPADLPPVPTLAPKNVEDLRPVNIAKINMENAQKNFRSVRSQNSAQVDFVGRARSTGVDTDNGRAVSEMTAGTKPYFYVGLEISAPLNSDLQRGQIADAEVALQQAENQLLIQRIDTRDSLMSIERDVTSQFAIAKSAAATIDLRARVVRDMEAAYRQGRQPLINLIQDYNALFNAQLASATATGNYHILLNRLAAARDELVVQNPDKKND